METKRYGNQLLIRLEKGEEVTASIEKICEEYGVKAGIINGLGAASYAKICLYDVEKKEFSYNEINMPLEIASITGNVSEMEGKVYLHNHIVLADGTGRCYGGHLKEVVISATAEIFITVIDGKIGRRADTETGLNLWMLE